jgi:hypothetical protein
MTEGGEACWTEDPRLPPKGHVKNVSRQSSEGLTGGLGLDFDELRANSLPTRPPSVPTVSDISHGTCRVLGRSG